MLQYYLYYGDDFTVECPTGSGRQMNLYQVAEEIARRLANIFLKDKDGRRPVYGGTREVPGRSALARLPPVLRVLPRRQRRPASGASHQTGWTGVIARAMHLFATLTPESALEGGKRSYSEKQARAELSGSLAGR